MTGLVLAFSLFYSQKTIPECHPTLTPVSVTLAGYSFPLLRIVSTAQNVESPKRQISGHV